MFKNWTNRDWFWLLGFLIITIIFLIASIFAKSKNIELNFSIISSAVSIALALVAISFAWKQDSDNQIVTRETSQLLSIITTKIESVDSKIDRLDPKLVTTPVEVQLKDEIEKIINEKDTEVNPELIRKINSVINQKFDTINNELEGYINPKKIQKCVIELIGPVDKSQMNKLVNDIMKNINTNGIASSLDTEIPKVTFSTDSYDLIDLIPKLVSENGLKLKASCGVLFIFR